MNLGSILPGVMTLCAFPERKGHERSSESLTSRKSMVLRNVEGGLRGNGAAFARKMDYGRTQGILLNNK